MPDKVKTVHQVVIGEELIPPGRTIDVTAENRERVNAWLRHGWVEPVRATSKPKTTAATKPKTTTRKTKAKAR